MILRLKSLIRKEFIQIVRDPRTLGLTLLYPLIMLFILGYAITNDVRNIPLAVLDRDQSSQSRYLLEAYKASDYFTLDYYITSEDEMSYLIESNKARAAIIIPPDYGENLISGRTAEVAFIIDGSDPNIANTVLSAAVLIGQAQSTKIACRAVCPFRAEPASNRYPYTGVVQPGHGHCLLYDPGTDRYDPAVPNHLPYSHIHRP